MFFVAIQIAGAWEIFGLEAPRSAHVPDAVVLALVIELIAMVLLFERFLVPLPCPRCDEQFFASFITEVGFAKHCASCDLEIGTPAHVAEERKDDEVEGV